MGADSPTTPDSLDAKLTTLIDGLDVLETKLDDEVAAREGAIKAAKDDRDLKLKLMALVVAVAVLLGAGGVWVGVTAHRANDKSDSALLAARQGACHQDNIRIGQHNKLGEATEATRAAEAKIQVEIDQIVSLSTAVPAGTVLTQDQQQRLDALRQLADTQKTEVDDQLDVARKLLIESLVAERDCTIEGIATYLAGTTR